MKLASFVAGNRSTFGLVVGNDALVDLGARVGDRHGNLRRLIASGELEQVARQHGNVGTDYTFGDIRFLPPIPNPLNILACGGNFPGHIQEMVDAGMIKGASAFPGFHIKTASSLVGHDNPLVKPRVSDQLDWENEFAIIIAKPCWRVSREDAMDYVLGYSILNDGSVRDFQLQHSVAAGKNFDRSSSFGPWIATKDEVGDTAPLFLTTRLNGEVVQHEQIGSLVFPPDLLISYVSQIVRLQPGDVITTGTTGGVGFFRKPQLFMKAGDKIEFEADRVGIMRHDIIDEE